ncbi:MAG: TonB-dependent receptor [Nitrosomonadales bacterium]|nr:TonB-dependent receptor [Nitrosomonadales bacterium]
MKQKFITVALFGAITLPFAAHAEAPMEMIIVTPTRMEQPLNETLADTTVLDEQAIRQSGASDVQTLLRNVAGVEIYQSGGLGNQSSTFMRGTNSSHVLVLLDGVRISSATAGTTALEHIMLDSIERIEVVRGNVSSLYGSEAIGGVIQLFTRRGRGTPDFSASAGIGSHGTKRLAAGYSGSTEATSFSVNAGKVTSNGVSAINTDIAPTANPDNDGYDNTTFNAQVQHAISAGHKLSASFFSTRGDSSYDVSGAWGNAPTDLHHAVANIRKISVASDNRLTDTWQSHLSWAQGMDDSKGYLNGAESSHINTNNKQLVWQNEVRLADKQRVNLAVERLEQSVDSNTLYAQTARSVNSMLGGYVAEYGTQQVQLNLRQDHYSDFGVTNTGLIGYGLSFTDSLRATVSISSAFKAPTFNDLYAPAAWGSNPALRPERSNSKEVGLRYVSGGQQLHATYFDNRITDLIAADSTWTLQNLNSVHINGAELGYSGEFGNTSAQASLTLQNPRDVSNDQVLLRRAKSFANLGVAHRIGKSTVGGEWQHSSARTDYDINTFARTSLAAYDVVNVTARYELNKVLEFSARVDNLFNRDYMLAHGYNTLGRTLFVGLNYQP